MCFLGYGDCGNAGFLNKGSFSGGGSSGENEDFKIDTVQQCKNEGFSVTSCSLPTYPTGICPYNNAYFVKCVEDKPRACKETGYKETSCADGKVVDTTCSYDANYKKCKCDPCSGYDYTYAQATAQGYVPDGSCLSCSETKYKRKENPCSGYSVCECGGAAGASVCYTGATQKYNSCKTCDPCPGYYDCGGAWQYCEGSVCSADSSRCSTYCESNHFPYSCGSDYGPCYGDYRSGYCSVPCDEIETDPCANVTCGSNASCSNGSCSCNSGYEGNANTGCTPVASDNCNNRTAVISFCPANASCNFFSDCPSKIQSWDCYSNYSKSGNSCVKNDPCNNYTGETCVYGCRTYYSDCSSKCETCYSDNCRNRTAVSVPSNATCSSYFSDCSSKCETWDCNSGYRKDGDSCVCVPKTAELSCPLSPSQWEEQLESCNRKALDISDGCGGTIRCYVSAEKSGCSNSGSTNCVDYDGQDCAYNDCPTFTCTCCPSFGDFNPSCCTYDDPNIPI